MMGTDHGGTMSFDHLDRFVLLFSCGIGLFVTGGLSLLLVRAAPRWRAMPVGVGCATALGGVATWGGDQRLLPAAAAVLAVAMLPALLTGSAAVVGLARRAAALALRPGVRWGLLAAVGLTLATGSAAVFEVEESARIDRDMYELGLEEIRPPLVDLDQVIARTDRGSPVVLRRAAAPRSEAEILEAERRYFQSSPYNDQVIRRYKPDDGSNCHGWVFAGGRYWVAGESVDLILRENGYVDVTDPRTGDLAVYRTGGTVTHTAIVRYVSDDSQALVKGKWAWMGVYLHRVDQSPYGTEYTFYRSSRRGHLLAGLDQSLAP
jgi:hypothetical protein